MNTKTKKIVAPILALTLCAVLLCAVLAGCKTAEEKREEGIVPPVEDTGISLNLYQPNPSRAGLWQTLAADYKAITGVTVNVKSPEAGAALTELKEAFKNEEHTPGVFLFNHPREYRAWQDNAADITGTEAYRHLIDNRMALTAEGKVIGLPVGVEAFGIIYNKKILDQYFALEDKTFASVNEITTYTELERFVKDLHNHKAALGIEGVFAAPAYKEGESGIWTTRLFSIPVGQELTARGQELTGEKLGDLTWNHGAGYRNFHDLMTGHATTKEQLENRSHADAVKEFASGKAALILGGTEFLGMLNSVPSHTVTKDDIAFLPVMLDMEQTGRQGLAFDVVEYAAINGKLSEENRLAASAFLNWLYTSEKGMDFLSNKLNVIAPYDSQNEGTLPNNPLSTDAFAWLKKEDTQNVVTWSALTAGEEFRDKVLGSNMTAYHNGESDWNEFKQKVDKGWADLRESWDQAFR